MPHLVRLMVPTSSWSSTSSRGISTIRATPNNNHLHNCQRQRIVQINIFQLKYLGAIVYLPRNCDGSINLLNKTFPLCELLYIPLRFRCIHTLLAFHMLFFGQK